MISEDSRRRDLSFFGHEEEGFLDLFSSFLNSLKCLEVGEPDDALDEAKAKESMSGGKSSPKFLAQFLRPLLVICLQRAHSIEM